MSSPYRLQAISSLKIVAYSLLYCKARANYLLYVAVAIKAIMKVI
jgi:hypothetical protein